MLSDQISQFYGYLNPLSKKDALSFELHGYTRSDNTTSFDKKDQQSSVSQSQHINLRVSQGDKAGVSYTKDFSKSSLEDCYQKAKNSLQLTDNSTGGILSENQKYQSENLFYNKDLENHSLKDQLEYTKKIHTTCSAFHKKIQPVKTFIGNESLSYFFANSKDSQAVFKISNIFVYSHCLGIDGDSRCEAVLTQHFRSFSSLNPEQIGKNTAKLSLKKLNYKIPQTKTYPVIFKPEKSGALLLSKLTELMSGKKVFENLSILKHSLGKKIFSDNLSIYDEPLAKWGSQSQIFDGEGFASERTDLVKNGVLKKFLTSSFYSKKLQIPNTKKALWIENTGHLDVSTTNLVMSKGGSSFEEMLSEFPQVIVIDNLKSFSAYNPISGEFSIESEGFFYEEGNFMHPLAQFTVSGNIIELFANILKIEDHLSSSACVKAPSFLVPELMIAGK